MKRITLVLGVVAVMVAMLVALAAPAMARDFDFNDHDNDFDDIKDVNQFGIFDNNDGFFDSDLDQESESGDVENNFRVSNTGDFASQTTPALQFSNTGNFNNGSSFVQFDSVADAFEPGGIEFTIGPEQSTRSDNAVLQSSGAFRR